MSFLVVNMVTVSVFLSVFLVSGVGAGCSSNPPLSITAPKKMEALSGSCLQIPCNFTPKKKEEFDSSREIFGVWIKSDPRFALYPDNVIFNSSKTVNTYPMNITGNLRERNCTTLFTSLVTDYTNTYYFRIENKPFMATATWHSLQITVQDSPARPSIEVPAGLKEKQSVTITCSAFTPCPHSPPQLTWSLQQHPHNYMKENPDGTFTRQIQETITLSDHHDGSRISCSVTYPVNEGRDVKTAEETVTLSVSYAPKNTSVSVSPSGLVSAGTWVTLTCSSRARPPVRNFTWFKNSTDGIKPVAEGAVYSLNVTEGGVYFCEAQNDLGQERSPEKTLSVRDAPKDTSVSVSPSGLVSAGTWVTLTCCSRARPPVRNFTWFKISSDGVKPVAEGAVYSLNVTDGGVYFCEAQNDLGQEKSPVVRLIDDGKDETATPHVYVTVKMVGIVLLYSSLLIFQCCFRSRRCSKPVENAKDEADYVNTVTEVQAS
ncbi:uncharacterized protein V6R79_026426 [Siganus canaliculatus]